MTSSKNFVLILLALTTIGGAGLAWTQYRELVELRAAALDPDDRDQLRARIGELESMNRSLQDELTVAQANNIGPDGMITNMERPAPDQDRGRGGPRGERGPNRPQQQLNAIRDLASKPEVQALLRVQQQAAVDARYAALFRNLNLSPEQAGKLKNLLAERQTTLQDVMMAARDQGVDLRSDPEGFRKLISDAQNEINNSIKSVIGDGGFAQLQSYEQTLPQRNLVNDLQQRLSYSDAPLTPAQAEQLVQILAANAPQRGTNDPAGPNRGGQQGIRAIAGFGGPGGDLGMLAGAFGGGPGGGMFNVVMDGGGRGGGTATVTSGAVAQAQAILAPTQLSALQQIQQQQQSQQQLQQLMRSAVGGQSGGQTGGNTGTPTTKKRRTGG